MICLAFLKKEGMELVRTGRLPVLLMIFTLFGILNPALAKLTPWLYDTLAESMASQGLILTDISVDALTSWNQFYKNISLAVIVFSVMIAAPLAEEYKKQTLIPLMARGLTLPTAACAKAAAAVITWTLCYWLCFLITWLYNLWFWGNKDISHTLAAAAFIWLFGLWVTTLLFLGSVLFRSVSGALLMAAAGALAGWILTLFAKTAAWSPMQLLSAGTLLNLQALPEDYKKAALAALVTGLAAFGSALLASRKQNAL